VTGRLAGVLILVAVLTFGAAGCKDKSASIEQSGVPTGTPEATSSVGATASADAASEPVDAANPDSSNSSKPDTSAIEKELAAIEKELDALSMPGDSDFSAIEGDLP